VAGNQSAAGSASTATVDVTPPALAAVASAVGVTADSATVT